MNIDQLPEILFLVVIAVVIGVAVLKMARKHVEEIHSPEELINYLGDILTDKIVPYIFKISMEEDLNECINFIQFRNKCKDKVVDELCKIMSDANDEFNIPDYLKQFITKENIEDVIHRALQMTDVDDFLYKQYMNLVYDGIEKAKELDEKVSKINDEIGVEDDETLVKEDLGIANPKEPEDESEEPKE